MKRKEMVEHIKAELEELIQHLPNVSEKRMPHYVTSKAEGLLDMMEGFGMLPPAIKNPSYSEEEARSYASHPFAEYNVPATFNCWELDSFNVEFCKIVAESGYSVDHVAAVLQLPIPTVMRYLKGEATPMPQLQESLLDVTRVKLRRGQDEK